MRLQPRALSNWMLKSRSSNAILFKEIYSTIMYLKCTIRNSPNPVVSSNFRKADTFTSFPSLPMSCAKVYCSSWFSMRFGLSLFMHIARATSTISCFPSQRPLRHDARHGYLEYLGCQKSLSFPKYLILHSYCWRVCMTRIVYLSGDCSSASAPLVSERPQHLELPRKLCTVEDILSVLRYR